METEQETLKTIFAHRSIRKFTDQAIEPELLHTLITAGQASSTSNFMQNVSIIRVNDPKQRAAIRPICAAGGKGGHYYVEQCAEFLVFCADTTRHTTLVPESQMDWTEILLMGAVDVGIFSQTVLLAAESVGLGGVFIGGIRNNLPEIANILALPEGVFPIVGMCLGYPDQDPMTRTRLPYELIVSENQFKPASKEDLLAYNEVIRAYYQNRSQIDLDWVQQIRNSWSEPVRPEVLSFAHKQGFAKR